MYIVLGQRITLDQIVNLKLFIMNNKPTTTRKTLRGPKEVLTWVEQEIIRLEATLNVFKQVSNEDYHPTKTIEDIQARLIAMQDVSNYINKY